MVFQAPNCPTSEISKYFSVLIRKTKATTISGSQLHHMFQNEETCLPWQATPGKRGSIIEFASPRAESLPEHRTGLPSPLSCPLSFFPRHLKLWCLAKRQARGLPGDPVVKNPPVKQGLIPGLGKSPGEGKSYPL